MLDFNTYWFLDDAGRSNSVSSEVYLKLLQENSGEGVWFLQDCAPVHTTLPLQY